MKQDIVKRRFRFYGMVLICSLCVLLLFLSHRLVTSTSVESYPFQYGRSIDNWNNKEIGKTESDTFLNMADYNMIADVLNVVKIQRRLVAHEM